MDDNLAIFLVLVVAIGAAVLLTLAMAWLRAGNRRPVGEEAERSQLLERENDQLTGKWASWSNGCGCWSGSRPTPLSPWLAKSKRRAEPGTATGRMK